MNNAPEADHDPLHGLPQLIFAVTLALLIASAMARFGGREVGYASSPAVHGTITGLRVDTIGGRVDTVAYLQPMSDSAFEALFEAYERERRARFWEWVDFRAVMAGVISLAILSSCLWIVLSRRYEDAEKKWAFGAIGTVIGYWLGG